MRNFDSLASLKATLCPVLRCWPFLAIGLFSSSFALAQSTPAKAGAASASPSGGDFSIETEMLTYSALESNSEAVACDVAAYVNKTSANFSNPPAGTVCSVNGGNTAATVLIFPFDRSEFSDFQIWRADMAAMSQLRTRAEVSFQCPKGARTRGAAASTAGSIAASLSPYGAMAETALGMMATEESATSVIGTIQDQALMDGVARQLRSLRVKVLMPSAYTSFGFIADDEAHSPFMTNLDKLIDARGCLADLAAAEDTKDKAGAAQMAKDIDDFFKSLTESVAVPPNPNAAPKPTSASTTATTPAPAPAPPAPTRSHLAAALSADGLAQKLGLDLTTGTLPNRNDWPHILLLKALESGGAVTKSSSILKTTMSYSGGSVATYSLFRLDGEVECSGNVFDFSGTIPSKNFVEKFHESTINPARQLIFSRGSCNPPSQ